MARFIQGIYKPINSEKYVGQGYPRYLSSYELHLFRFLDRNPNVVCWGSENIIIPYISPVDHKGHRYFVDNFVVIKEGEVTKKYLIEVKPHKQTLPPQPHGNKKRSTILYESATYAVNQAKWKAAHDWCNARGFQFIILTEKDLFREKS